MLAVGPAGVHSAILAGARLPHTPMHVHHLLGAVALATGLGFTFLAGSGNPPADDVGAIGASAPQPTPPNGHFALVVEGDRDQLGVTFARHKPDPWAGAPKGMLSPWTLSIRDAAGVELAVVPLDMSKFDLRAASKGNGLDVQGCVVTDSRVSMLVSVPSIAHAASYVFLRDRIVVSVVDAQTVNQLAGGGR